MDAQTTEAPDTAACPNIDFDPVAFDGAASLPGIISSPVFARACEFFGRTTPWSEGLVCAEGLALMYHAIRALRPATVVEIGTNKGWTSYVFASALDANGGDGQVHTVGPYDSWRFMPNFERWPEPLRQRTTFYALNSAHFFQHAFDRRQRFDMIFVDGNHDYEFALFDIQCSARAITPGGIVFVDNMELGDVRRAVADFLAKNPSWIDWTSRCVNDLVSGRHVAILRSLIADAVNRREA